ncbi:hypothetical protein [Agromyces sp. SYSU T0242]|uniref:hypothetical protein n=1 Tax=Agromyces litoreus TaxID=3158561 RepID=UPI003398B7F0
MTPDAHPTATMTVTKSIPLGPDDLACYACGCAVPPPHGALVDVEGMPEWVVALDDPRPRAGKTTTMTRCARCEQAHERAATLLDEHPRVKAQMGSRSIGLHRVEAALNALDAIGRDTPLHTDASLRLLVEHMTPLGVAVRWASQFTPVWTKEARDDVAASQPWEHVTTWQREDLRKAFAGLLNARVERPLPYGPPTGGGCMLCGVETVSALPSQAAGLWTPATVDPSAIGGRRSPERVAGYLCPTCDRARSEVGSLGPTAMERSVMLHFALRRRSMTPTELVGLRGWLVSGVDEPNERPWEHILNIEDVAEHLRG